MDVDKVRVLSESVTACIIIPRRLRVIAHKAKTIELVQFQRVSEFVNSLRSAGAAGLGLDKTEFAGAGRLERDRSLRSGCFKQDRERPTGFVR